MKTKTKTTTTLIALMLMFTMSVQAQTVPSSNALASFVPTTPVGDAANVDVESMRTEAWEELSSSQSKALVSSDETIKQQALQNIIYFATHFPNEVTFDQTSMNLYNIYRFDGNEGYRIMALAAMHAVGDDNAMRLLGQHVTKEKSPKVRRLTNAVLLDYFGPQENQ